MNTKIRIAAASALGAALLAACGGGGSDTATAINVSSVQMMGDSLQDSGTFGGVKATVQGADSTLYVERVSLAYGKGRACNYFAFNGTTFVANPAPGCKNYSIGGGVINGASSGFSAGDPRIIGVQIAAATAGGNFAPADLLVVDGGGNDAAGLVGAYLRAQPAPAGDGGAAYIALLGTQLSAAEVGAAVGGGAAGLATAGAQYMTALAANFHGTIKSGLLDRGAQRIVLMNIPAITNTPRFQLVLDGIAAATTAGGGNGAAARAQSEALFRGWVAAFNAELARRVAGDGRVVLVDLAKAFDDQIAAPAQYGVTNNRTPACPITGVGSDGLPAYDFATCTASALSAAPPSGASGGANWWKTYYFSDGFHPTPYGHQLAYQLIAKSLAAAGWL